jgi:hypothetical protein
MTTTSHQHEYTDLDTPMHIASATPRVQIPPAYKARFGLAAVVLSLLGVAEAETTQPIEERTVASQVVANPEASQREQADEWDQWKSNRDLG